MCVYTVVKYTWHKTEHCQHFVHAPHHTTITALPFLNHLHRLARKLHPLSSPSPVLFWASATTNLLALSLWICLPWTFHVNAHTKRLTLVSGFFHLAECFQGSMRLCHVSGLHSSSRLNHIPLTICKIPHFVYQFVDRHLDCFHFLAIVNYERVYTFLSEHLFSILLGIYQEWNSRFNLWRNCQTISHSGWTVLMIPTNGSQFFHILTNTRYFTF